MIGLNLRDRSSRLLSLRRGRFQIRIVSRMAFAALCETAGRKLMKNFPLRCFDFLGRKVYPRKSNFSFGCVPRRSSSLQSTIFVFSGWSSSPQARKRSAMAFRTAWACLSVLHCAMTSSAYRSNDT